MQSQSLNENDEPQSVVLDSPGRIYYWTTALGATPAEIRAAVKVAGSGVAAVRLALTDAHKAHPADQR